MQNASYQRAMLLLEQDRFPDAERELKAALLESPQDGHLHAMLALVLLAQSKLNDATSEAQQAVTLEPDEPLSHSALASVLHGRNRPGEALAPLNEAIRLDPFDPKHYALLAQIKLEQRNWRAALEAANKGLEIDPAHPHCVNLRGIALVQLGDRDGASQTIQGALQRDPENAVTHANQGWALLHRNQPKPAMEHFRESLRIDPTNDWARAGIVEAMKARNPFYRVLLAYFLFMSRQARSLQIGIVVGGWVGYQALNSVLKSHPHLSYIAVPLMVAYVLFALSTWLAPVLMNLLLRFDRFGRYALSRDQVRTSNLIAGLIVCSALLFLANHWSPDDHLFTAGVMTAVLCLPAAMLFNCEPGWPRWCGVGVVMVLVAIGATEVYWEWADPRPGYIFNGFYVFIWAALISQFAMPFLAAARVRQ